MKNTGLSQTLASLPSSGSRPVDQKLFPPNNVGRGSWSLRFAKIYFLLRRRQPPTMSFPNVLHFWKQIEPPTQRDVDGKGSVTAFPSPTLTAGVLGNQPTRLDAFPRCRFLREDRHMK